MFLYSNLYKMLQQYLPFTVLKPTTSYSFFSNSTSLQQYLPFTVLKHIMQRSWNQRNDSCNSTYRLRYWNSSINNPSTKATIVATVLTVYGIETTCEFHIVSRNNVLVATVLTVYGIETSSAIQHCNNYCSCNSTYRLRYWNRLNRFFNWD